MSEHPRQTLADVGLTPSGHADDGVPPAEPGESAAATGATATATPPKAGPAGGRSATAEPKPEPAPKTTSADGAPVAPKSKPVDDGEVSGGASGPPWKAIASIVVAVLGFLILGVILGPVAVGLGVWARADAKRNPRVGGDKAAIVGIVLGALAFVAFFVFLALK